MQFILWNSLWNTITLGLEIFNANVSIVRFRLKYYIIIEYDLY